MNLRDTDRRPIGYWVKQLDRLLEERLAAALAEYHLVRRHWQVLAVLAADPATCAEIGERLAPFQDSGPVDVDGVLADLVGRGWVARDGERYALTEAGRRTHARALDAVSAVRGQVAAGITAEQYGETVRVLRRMADNLSGH